MILTSSVNGQNSDKWNNETFLYYAWGNICEQNELIQSLKAF